MHCPQHMAGRYTRTCQQHKQQPCLLQAQSQRIKRLRRCSAHPSTQEPRTPSPTPVDTSAAYTPADLTLVETAGRNQTTHTWSLTTSTVSSANSSQDEPASTSDSFSYSVSQQQLPSQQQHNSTTAAGASPASQHTPSSIQDAVAQLRESLSTLFLPAGYPSSVTDDYLAYQLATVPAHITGWLSISLTTSSLLKAVGISAGPVGATAAAAAIKWIVKDGIGAAGRLLVGGRLGLEFDDDPRRWRMAAEALTTLGLSLEIATAVFPQNFPMLASLGNFSKAVGKGMGKPVFRVIQTHFAAAGNVGAVAAKEEVWEVSAQLVGYGLSVLLLQQLQDAGSWQTVVGIWAVTQGAHVAFRYAALKTLRFRYLNQKRAKLLVAAHVRGQPLPSIHTANIQEPFFTSAADLAPHITLGCSLAQAWAVAQPAALQPDLQQQQQPGALQPALLLDWWRLYEGEGYLLNWQGGRASVVIKEGWVGGDRQQGGVGGKGGKEAQQQQRQVLLRALWQAAWLDAHSRGALPQQQQQQQQHQHVGSMQQQQQHYQQQGSIQHQDQPQDQHQEQLALLHASLAAMRAEFDGFVSAAQALGWVTDQVVLKVGVNRVTALMPAGSDSD